MMAVVLVLGGLALQGCQTTASKVEQDTYFANFVTKHADDVVCRNSKELSNPNNIFTKVIHWQKIEICYNFRNYDNFFLLEPQISPEEV